MALSIVNIATNTILDSSHDGKMLRLTGGAVLTLPASSSVPVGWHIPVIANRSLSSQLVWFRPQGADILNGHWSSSHPYGLPLNMTQQAAELVLDSPGQYFLMGKTFHRNVGQSQRTFVSVPGGQDSFNVRMQDINEEIQINAGATAMGIYFDPLANFSPKVDIGQSQPGNYHSFWIRMRRVDGGPHICRVFAFSGQTINNAPYLDLQPGQTLTFYLTSSQIWAS